VQNVSSIDLRVKKMAQLISGRDTGVDEDEMDVVILVGAEGDSAAVRQRDLGSLGHPVRLWYDPGYFRTLRSGEDRMLADSVDILCINDFIPQRAARYWMLARFQNYAFKESDPPYWTGQVESDTVWFRVVE